MKIARPNLTLHKSAIQPPHSLLAYPRQKPQTLQCKQAANRLRAGVVVFPGAGGLCLACGNDNGRTSHILRCCYSTRNCLNTWLLHLSPSGRASFAALSDNAFVSVVFDFRHETHQGLEASAIAYVHNAVASARLAAIRRRGAI